jgi:septal ring factor EnvC (AmiA/AmiB activator)
MARSFDLLPRFAIFLAGVAAGALTRRDRGPAAAGVDAAAVNDLKQSLMTEVETRIATLDSANANRFSQIESKLEQHSAKLAEVPTTAQLVAAMEGLLSKTMASLDERLTTQAHSIEVLKTTVSQTDSLLERVLESLDSLQTYTDPAEFAEDALLQRPAV